MKKFILIPLIVLVLSGCGKHRQSQATLTYPAQVSTQVETKTPLPEEEHHCYIDKDGRHICK